tara:strand:- start:254 stop:511 length:258 start_codon:yes stop_codon:yes gene_type:complete
MGRYDKTKKSNINYRTTIYQEVPEKNDDMYFIAQAGDRCDNLAYRFYNDANLWWFIAKVNNLNSMNIPAGTSLRIPISIEKASGF